MTEGTKHTSEGTVRPATSISFTPSTITPTIPTAAGSGENHENIMASSSFQELPSVLSPVIADADVASRKAPEIGRTTSCCTQLSRIEEECQHERHVKEGSTMGPDAAALDSMRPISPALTEIEFPESQDLIEEVLRKGVKIRDFAYEPPYVLPAASTTSTSASDLHHIASTNATPMMTSDVRPPKRTTEIFDPFKALTEIDYRWTQTIRTYPVSGKTLRRLLDMEWLTPVELSARAHPMDTSALRQYDEQRAIWREANDGIEAFPWRPLRADRPTENERQVMVDNYRGHWKQQDKMMTRHEEKEEMKQKEDEMAREKLKEIREREREREREKKRRPGAAETEADEASGSSNKVGPSRFKKRRLSLPDGVAPGEYGRLIPPSKQYPAALQAYDPKLYPDAASVIEASSQTRPRPLYPPPSTTMGGDAPSAVGRTDTPLINKGKRADIDGSRRGQKLERKNGKLGRTQTFLGF